jgi:hypothetical protein
VIPTDASSRAIALDPTRSFIVQAPAGSGKTTLLVNRYLALLGGAMRPDEVLAITFTRKAADEMRARVIQELTRSASQEARAALARDRELDWRLLATPSRLRVQTIDAFAASLVRQLPASSGFERRWRVTERAEPLYERAAHRVLRKMTTDDPLVPYIARFLALHDNDANAATGALTTMLARRDQWLDAATSIVTMRDDRDRARRLNDALTALHKGLRVRLGAALGATGIERFDASIDEAAAELGISAPSHAFAAGTFLTRSGQLRRTLDKRVGFPAGSAAKARASEVLETLARQGAEDLLGDLSALPERLSPAEAADVLAVCATLSLAVLELSGIFRETGRTDFAELMFGARRAIRLLVPAVTAQAVAVRETGVLVAKIHAGHGIVQAPAGISASQDDADAGFGQDIGSRPADKHVLAVESVILALLHCQAAHVPASDTASQFDAGINVHRRAEAAEADTT